MPNSEVRVIRGVNRAAKVIEKRVVAKRIVAAERNGWLDDALEAMRNNKLSEVAAFERIFKTT